MTFRALPALLLAACLAFAASASESDEAARVVIVANADQPDSLALAQAYGARRQIPVTNIIAISLPADETISWDTYLEKIHHPLLARLIADQWIDGAFFSASDTLGRRRWIANFHRISYLVLYRGVPLRINHDPNRAKSAVRDR